MEQVLYAFVKIVTVRDSISWFCDPLILEWASFTHFIT